MQDQENQEMVMEKSVKNILSSLWKPTHYQTVKFSTQGHELLPRSRQSAQPTNQHQGKQNIGISPDNGVKEAAGQRSLFPFNSPTTDYSLDFS